MFFLINILHCFESIDRNTFIKMVGHGVWLAEELNGLLYPRGPPINGINVLIIHLPIALMCSITE